MNNNIGEYLMGFSKFHLVQVPVKHTLNSITSGLGVLKRITGTWGAYAAGAPTRRALLRGGRSCAEGAPARRALLAEGRSCGEN